MTVKDELHQLVDELPEAEAVDVLDYLRWLQADTDELTQGELEAMYLSEAEITRGEFVTLDVLRRELASSST